MYTPEPLEIRLWKKVIKLGPDDCWIWTGGVNENGYGRIISNNKRLYVHRVAWTTVHGPIPKGMKICHTCDNPPCCNPNHLFAGTDLDNARDREQKKRGQNGQRNGNAKLTWDDIGKIRELSADGIPQPEIARKFHTKQSNVSQIVNNRTWRKR